MASLAKIIVQNKKLTRLNVAHNHLKGQRATELIHSVGLSNIESLDLSWNPLGNEAGKQLVIILKENKTLK